MADKKSARYKAAVGQLNDELTQGVLREVDNADLVRLGIDRVGIDQMTTLFRNPLNAQAFSPKGFDRAELERVGYIGGGDVDLTKPAVIASVGNMADRTPRQNRADIAHEYAHAGIAALPRLNPWRRFSRGMEEVIVRHQDISRGDPVSAAEGERYIERKYPDRHAAMKVKGEEYYNRLSDEAAKKLYDEGKRMSPDRQKAAELASRGRYGDSMLVHMNPLEVKAMHEASPMGLTINPDTGQPEAFLPLLMGLGGGWLGSMYAPAALGAYGAAAGSGLGAFGGSMMEGRDPKDALMAGLLAGGTTAALGAFGDAAVEPNIPMAGKSGWHSGFAESGVPMSKGAMRAFEATPAGTPVPARFVKEYGAPASYFDKIGAGFGEGSPSLEQTFSRAVENPAFYGGAGAATVGALGGGLDPLMGVPQYNIPEVEEDEPRGPNPYLGRNKVFWGKPASWTDADGEWQFYWPQGVTPPGYAHGGIVRGYQAGGAVDKEALARGRQRDWGFRTPDPVSRGVDAPIVDPLGADPLDTTLSPILPVDDGEGGVSDPNAPSRGLTLEQKYALVEDAPEVALWDPADIDYDVTKDAPSARGSIEAVEGGGLPGMLGRGLGGIFGAQRDYVTLDDGRMGWELGWNPASLVGAFTPPGVSTLAQALYSGAGGPNVPLSVTDPAKSVAEVVSGASGDDRPGGGGDDGGFGGSYGGVSADEMHDAMEAAGVFSRGGMVRGYAHGDMVAAPQAQQPQQPNPIVMGAVAAIKGQHPEPQKAVMAFVQTYGQPAFAQLRQQVIMAERQGTGLGGGAVRGPGDGLSDSVPANIDGQEPVALSDGEVVVPADVVSGLGNGSSEAGAKTLEEMNESVRQARTGKTSQPGAIDPMQMLPA